MTNSTSEQRPTLQSEKLEPCPFCGGPSEKRLTDGPKRGFIGCFTCMIGLPFNVPYSDKEIAAWNSRSPVASFPPMCAVHAALDRKDTLVLEVGNDCIACSLHERTAILNLLEPFAAEDGSQDSLTVLRNVIASAAASLPASSPVPPEQCLVTCADFPMHACDAAHRCVRDAGHPFDPQYAGEIHEFESHQTTVKPRVAAMPTPVEQEAMQLELKIAKEFIAEHVGVEPEIEYEPKEID